MISPEQSDFIRSLANANGEIEPRIVIAAARDPSSPIHSAFTWDVELAAEQHWIDQARTLIRFVKLEIVVHRQSIVAPFYVPLPDRAPRSRTYIQLDLAAREREQALKILTAELDRIASAIRRAQQVAAVLDLTAKLDEWLEDVSQLQTKAERSKEEKRSKQQSKARGGKRRGKRPQGRTRPELRA